MSELEFYIKAILCLSLGCGGILYERYIRLCWRETEGKVVGFEMKREDHGKITPVVVYFTSEGRVESHSNFYGEKALCKYHIGQTVNVYYKENNVKKFRIMGDKSRFFWYTIIAILTGIAVASRLW